MTDQSRNFRLEALKELSEYDLEYDDFAGTTGVTLEFQGFLDMDDEISIKCTLQGIQTGLLQRQK